MKRLRKLIAREEGFALVLALGLTVLLSMTVVTVIESSMSNSRQSNVSMGRIGASSLAEAGINNALAVLTHPNTNALQQSALPSTEADASQKSYPDGTAKWWGILTGSNWILHGVGLVRNPSGPGAPDLRRESTATVDVILAPTQPMTTKLWDYLMNTGTGSPCDMTIADGSHTGNPATIVSRLYVYGNLCLGTSDGGIGLVKDSPLMVKGKLSVNSPSSAVGSSGAPINEMHIGQGCTYLTQALHNPCQVGAGGSPAFKDNIWATVVDTVVPDITAPTPDWNSSYTNAKPGPMQACTTTSGSPPAWDNNTTRDYSVYNASATAFDLTPASSYSCTVTDAYSNVLGKLDWNGSTKVLTIVGTVFIDGAAKVTNGALNQYTGQGTIYLSGTFYMSDGTRLCAAVSGTECDFAAWNPNTKLLGIVANGNGVQLASGLGIHLYNAQFQGALYATNTIRLEGTTRTHGPIIARRIDIGYNVSTSSAAANGFPLVTTVPTGLPGAPTTRTLVLPPRSFTGG
jgi:hypothetical protein